MPRLRYRYAAFFIVVCLLALWVVIWRFHETRSQDALSLWTDLQRDYVDQTARGMKLWVTMRMQRDGVDEATARQEAIEKFIKPILLVPGSGVWVVNDEELIYNKGFGFGPGRPSAHLKSVLAAQERFGGEKCSKLCEEILRRKRGSEWFVQGPEDGPVHASWTTVSTGGDDFTIGLSAPAEEVLALSGISRSFVREVGAGGIITSLAILLALFLWRQNRQDKKLITVMGENTTLMEDANQKLEKELAERQETEKTLRAGEALKNAVIDGIPSGLLRVDRDLRIRLVNRAALRASGMDRESLLGSFCYKVFAKADKPCPDCPALRSFESGALESSLITTPEGGMFRVRAFPVAAGNGEQDGVIVVVRDVTEKRRLEAQLRQSQKMEAIGTLAGGIAHDFNNVLTIISGNLELAEEDVPQQNPARICLEEALRACDRARDLVSQILSFSRRTETKPRLIRLHDAVQDSLHLLRHSIPSTIRVTVAEAAGPDTVMADPTQVSQILLNLTSNAAHAMREQGGNLSISVDNGEEDPLSPPLREDTPWGWVRLVFADSGPGIPPHLVKRVFDPYFTTKAVGEGTGMGLAVVHGIVTSYGGSIRVESEPGRGAAFFVYLPLVMGSPGEEVRERSSKLPGGNERVLLVDDELPVAQMAKEALERLGYRVTAHTQSLAALAEFALAPEGYDLIVTDQTMPHLTGLALSEKIHEIRPDVPVVLLTGFSESVTEATMAKAGVSELLFKPVSKATLAKAMRKALDTAAKA